jgi:hypothetical protein
MNPAVLLLELTEPSEVIADAVVGRGQGDGGEREVVVGDADEEHRGRRRRRCGSS